MPRITLDDFADLADLEPLDALIARAENQPFEGGFELLEPPPRSIDSAAARAYARMLEYGPDPEADLEPRDRTERWERIRRLGGSPKTPFDQHPVGELGTMPERMLQRETRMAGHGGGGKGTGKAKEDKPTPGRAKAAPEIPTTGWVPGPQLAIWVSRGTGEYFNRATLFEAARCVEAHVEQLTIARGYADEPIPKLNRRARLLVIRGCEPAVVRLAKVRPIVTSEALRRWALARAEIMVRSLDGIGA